MIPQASTSEHFNRLIAFRQAVYEHGLTQARDAQFELMDALLLGTPIRSFVELSLSPVFRRLWPSAYAAIADGRQDVRWVQRYLVQQVPSEGVQVFPLDTTLWPHPRAQTLPELHLWHSPTPGAVGKSLVRGHTYSLLAWAPHAHRSWALPLSVERVRPTESAITVGVRQVQRLARERAAGGSQGLTVIVGDGRYDSYRFLRPLRSSGCAQVVRLRRDRVLYRPAPPYSGRGRPRKRGARFAFQAPQTWGPPDAEVGFDDPYWGRVHLRRWDGLHLRQAMEVEFSVIRVESHLERDQPPAAVWLGYQGPPGQGLAAQWRWYVQRWPIEPSIHFRKRRLHWTLPQFQRVEHCDRWTQLVSLAQWQVYLAREVTPDRPLPWQKHQDELTPGRVLAGVGGVFARIGSPARPPHKRGKSPGWPKGQPRPGPPRQMRVTQGRAPP